jgi:hypothetical protein
MDRVLEKESAGVERSPLSLHFHYTRQRLEALQVAAFLVSSRQSPSIYQTDESVTLPAVMSVSFMGTSRKVKNFSVGVGKNMVSMANVGNIVGGAGHDCATSGRHHMLGTTGCGQT